MTITSSFKSRFLTLAFPLRSSLRTSVVLIAASLADPRGPPCASAYSAGVASGISAILLDAGGVLVFPEPANLLPPLRAAGVDPDLAVLERAHYQAMATQDRQATPPG